MKNRPHLADKLKGMKIKNWEERIYDDGHRVVYVRYQEKSDN